MQNVGNWRLVYNMKTHETEYGLKSTFMHIYFIFNSVHLHLLYIIRTWNLHQSPGDCRGRGAWHIIVKKIEFRNLLFHLNQLTSNINSFNFATQLIWWIPVYPIVLRIIFLHSMDTLPSTLTGRHDFTVNCEPGSNRIDHNLTVNQRRVKSNSKLTFGIDFVLVCKTAVLLGSRRSCLWPNEFPDNFQGFSFDLPRRQPWPTTLMSNPFLQLPSVFLKCLSVHF